MKSNNIIALGLLFLLASCNPMKGIYDQLDKQPQPIVKKTAFTFTPENYTACASLYVADGLKDFAGDSDARKELATKLSKDAKSLSSYHYFNSIVSSKVYIPKLLGQLYGEWGDGSVISVTYNEQLPHAAAEDAVYNKLKSVILSADEIASIDVHNVSMLGKKDYAKIVTLAKSKVADAPLYIKASDSMGHQAAWIMVNDHLDTQNYYAMTTADFESMGFRYPNFSKSQLPENYLSTFMKLKFPYTHGKMDKVVVYNFYMGNKKTVIGTQSYSFDGNEWARRPYSVPVTSQYLNNGKGWLFDPTIVLGLNAPDFEFLYNWVKANHPNYVDKKYSKNTERWFGGSSYYKNFSFDPGETVGSRDEDKNATGDALLALYSTRVKDGIKLLLKDKYPDKPALADGVQQYYLVKAVIRYQSTNVDYELKYKGLGNGDFEFVESMPHLPGLK